jgi:hypothetical protein
VEGSFHHGICQRKPCPGQMHQPTKAVNCLCQIVIHFPSKSVSICLWMLLILFRLHMCSSVLCLSLLFPPICFPFPPNVLLSHPSLYYFHQDEWFTQQRFYRDARSFVSAYLLVVVVRYRSLGGFFFPRLHRTDCARCSLELLFSYSHYCNVTLQ